jgi:hypothetical protein
MELAKQVGVVLIAAVSGEQPRVLESSYGLADAKLNHDEAP